MKSLLFDDFYFFFGLGREVGGVYEKILVMGRRKRRR